MYKRYLKWFYLLFLFGILYTMVLFYWLWSLVCSFLVCVGRVPSKVMKMLFRKLSRKERKYPAPWDSGLNGEENWPPRSIFLNLRFFPHVISHDAWKLNFSIACIASTSFPSHSYRFWKDTRTYSDRRQNRTFTFSFVYLQVADNA